MVTRCAEPVWEQLSLFASAQEQPMKFPNLRMVGDIVGRLVLAECEEAMGTDAWNELLAAVEAAQSEA